jgi:hypothetical protein
MIMGKKQTAQEKETKRQAQLKQPKNVLHIEYYVKKNGAIGMKKYFKKEEQNAT